MKRKFEPIAVIGSGCALPGCFTPEELWSIVKDSRVVISSAPKEYWRAPIESVIQSGEAHNDKGGYVQGFSDAFNANEYGTDTDSIRALDPLFQWSLYAAHSAFKNAGIDVNKSNDALTRTGIILGNLAYPSASHSRLYEEHKLNTWTENSKEPTTDYRNRYSASYPAQFVKQTLNLGGEAYCLDAACASSLYAIKAACDSLQTGSVDCMLAGGVNATDSLFLHTGFTALQALSPSGQSRPFHKDADGLIPAEGAGFVVLKRLKDAVAQNDSILGVIRGIGLSNDGKSGGFLNPDKNGQCLSMKRAFEGTAIEPDDVSYVECHATGTTAGDAVELQSIAEFYGSHAPSLKTSKLPIGSLKGNVGHLITASGIAGMIKLLKAFEHNEIPSSPNATPANPLFASVPLVVPESPLKWENSDKNRVAALSSFGFGGNNAHLLLEEWNAERYHETDQSSSTETPKRTVAITAVEVEYDTCTSTDLFEQWVCKNKVPQGDAASKVQIDLAENRFPPNELNKALGQQLQLLELVQKCSKPLSHCDPATTGVFIGMETDSDCNRVGLRIRIDALLKEWGVDAKNLDTDTLKDSIDSALDAARVIGCMPNIPANRVNVVKNYSGQGFTVAAGEASGIASLNYAVQSIESGELSSALVGAIDLSDEVLHNYCHEKSGTGKTTNAAVVMVLKDYERALTDGDAIVALISSDEPQEYTSAQPFFEHLAEKFSKQGHAFAAEGLLAIAASVITYSHNTVWDSEKKTLALDLSKRHVQIPSVGQEQYMYLASSERTTAVTTALPQLETLSTHSIQQLIHELKSTLTQEKAIDVSTGHQSNASENDVRLSFVYEDSAQRMYFLQKAYDLLLNDGLKEGKNGPFYFSLSRISGKTAFVYTGAASAYKECGHELLTQVPQLIPLLENKFPGITQSAAWTYSVINSDSRDNAPYNELCSSSFVSQLHAVVSQQLLHVSADCAIGLSSGETNAIFAHGAWSDFSAMFNEIWECGLYQTALSQDFAAIKTAWGEDSDFTVQWENWRIVAPVETIQRIVKGYERVYLTIVNTVNDCVIAGDAAGCASVISVLREEYPEGTAFPLEHDLAVHCAAMEPFEATWRSVHTRPVAPDLPVTFYSNYLDGVYIPSDESVADALTGQAKTTIDFTKIISHAWDDGVRTFIEHGPRNSLSVAIKNILGDKDHLVVSMDQKGMSSVIKVSNTAAELWAAGIPIDISLFQVAPNKLDSGRTLPFSKRIPLHDEQIKSMIMQKNNSTKQSVEVMAAAPQLAGSTFDLGAFHSQKQPSTEIDSNSITVQAREMETAIQAVPNDKHEHKSVPTGNESLNLILQIQQEATAQHTAYLETQLQSFQKFNEMITTNIQNVVQSQGGIQSTTQQTPIQEERVSNETAMVNKPLMVNTSVKVNKPIVSTLLQEPIDRNTVIEKAPVQKSFPGPSFSRNDLEVLASGKMSPLLGEMFSGQDEYAIQVRMPEPPLLLCDRVLGIDAEPRSMETGTIWTETDVTQDSWYLHNGHMPGGIFIESGQADLLLISYLGIDFFNKGDKAYRLLGCEMEFKGPLPSVGETLHYDIHVDGHAQNGDSRLFFFHYDCHINDVCRISVRNGQAGFFSKEELAESVGVLWEPAEAEYTPNGRLEIPEIHTTKTALTQDEIAAYLNADIAGCFGEQFYLTNTHTRTPKTPSNKMNFIGDVTEYSIKGGPAERGYLKVETDIIGDEWFFNGHFKNDECMPGTLMAEACLQMMSLYMVGLGYTVRKDGWRFEPTIDTKYTFICRGQVTPQSKKLVYEIFIDEIIGGDTPTVFAHVLCSIDGKKAFLCERLGLSLVPDWPMSSHQLEIIDTSGKDSVEFEGFSFDYTSLLNCAWGKPTDAFGDKYQIYNTGIRSSRLPGPPYHFMTRITELDAEYGNPYTKPTVVAEYDIPEDAWYFSENGKATMPYCVLMEVALQPCGWLASFCRDESLYGEELLFRNLDGLNAIQHYEVPREKGTIVTRVTMTSASITGMLIINQFTVESFLNETLVYSYETSFGFFPKEAMENQKGLPITEDDTALLECPNNITIDLTQYPKQFFGFESACLPASKLLMLDRITAWYPGKGRGEKGYMRAEKDVNSKDWFFKAHFFQDPVQPGSLGVEAILQLMQANMLQRGYQDSLSNPMFEPIVIGEPVEWHYRGQIAPHNKKITIDIEIDSIDKNETQITMWALAKVWVDGIKIYQLPKVGMRMVANTKNYLYQKQVPWELSLQKETWLNDHKPAYSYPVAPFTKIMELALDAVTPKAFNGSFPKIEMKGHSWLSLEHQVAKGSVTVLKETSNQYRFSVQQQKYNDTDTVNIDSVVECASGTVTFVTAQEIKDIPELTNGVNRQLPYGDHTVFHGPAYQCMTELLLGANGATATVSTHDMTIPQGTLNHGALDAALHAIPHDTLHVWDSNISESVVAYPYKVSECVFTKPIPMDASFQIEVRYVELLNGMFPVSDIWILHENTCIGYFQLTEVLVPKGIATGMSGIQRFNYLSKKAFDPEIEILTQISNEKYSLSQDLIASSNWLPRTIEHIYAIAGSYSIVELTRLVLIKEYSARVQQCHPADLTYKEALLLNDASVAQELDLTISYSGKEVVLTINSGSLHEMHLPSDNTKKSLGAVLLERDVPPVFSDIFSALHATFVDSVLYEYKSQFDSNHGSTVYLANHQTAIESLLVSVELYAQKGGKISIISKKENQEHWLGALLKIGEQFHQHINPFDILFFERDDPTSLLSLVDTYMKSASEENHSLLVHVGGTREQSEHERIQKISSFIIDAALQHSVPIVPLLLKNGLPNSDQGKKYEYPYQFGKQNIIIGAQLEPKVFNDLISVDRSNLFLQKLYQLTDLNTEPESDDAEFEKKYVSLKERCSLNTFGAVCMQSLIETQATRDVQDKTVQLMNTLIHGKSSADVELKTIQKIFST